MQFFSPLNLDKNHLDILVFQVIVLEYHYFLINPKFNDKRGYDFQNNLMCLGKFRNSKN